MRYKVIYSEEGDLELEKVKDLIRDVNCSLFGTHFAFRIERDNKSPITGRIFIQIEYRAVCNISGEPTPWRGRKWYLSSHMTDDEVIKTAFSAFKAAVEHETMEGFKVFGRQVFNPHVDYKVLMEVSHKEVSRESTVRKWGWIPSKA